MNLLILIALSASLWLTNVPQQARLGGRAIDVTLVNSEDLSKVDWPAENFKLTQVTGIITADANVYSLLQANGIAPDSEAFTVVYDLNTSISGVGSLPPQTKLQLPKIVAGPKLQSLLQSGKVLVELTVDPEARNELNLTITSLQAYGSSVDQLSAQPATQAELSDLLRWFQEMKDRYYHRTDPPLREASLLQMRDEAQVLEGILQHASATHTPIGTDSARQISAIYGDVKQQMQQYGQTLSVGPPKAEQRYVVTVAILGGAHQYLSTLRVYYNYAGLFFPPPPAVPPGNSPGFKHVGSGQSEELLSKHYWIWAAKDGDPTHPVTPPYQLTVEDSQISPVSVELTLSHEGHP